MEMTIKYKQHNIWKLLNTNPNLDKIGEVIVSAKIIDPIGFAITKWT